MKIDEIREAIDELNWARKEYTGGTRDENRRTRLDAALAPHIAAVKALAIPSRFVRDIECQQEALRCAESSLARWAESQGPAGGVSDSTVVENYAKQHHDILRMIDYISKFVASMPAPDEDAVIPGVDRRYTDSINEFHTAMTVATEVLDEINER